LIVYWYLIIETDYMTMLVKVNRNQLAIDTLLQLCIIYVKMI